MNKKVVLITGGSSGIGKAIGTYLHEKGFIVYGTTRNLQKHPDFEPFKLLELDVRQEADPLRVVDQIFQEEGRIDILINNAGMGITGPVEETPYEEVQKVFETNFHGPLRMIKAVMPQMRKQDQGLIINITSIAGYMGLPYRGMYSASKGALGLITETLRMEAKSFGIHLTNLAPGDFATNIASGRYHAPVLEQSPYKNSYEASLALMNSHVDSGKDPHLVGRKVYKIIRSKHPRVHYTVGSPMQKFSLFLKNVLPDKVYERLLLNHYKL